ncbi:MAG TPA: NADH:ubiquinone reductase (Na(+)-transporting) subunit A [Myxococcota bacterium]|nr:NADH:ubiquinone reductase (Na(+)-transporting) subunit A [Myxococcota bacterium]
MQIRIRRGLDLPLAGEPVQEITTGSAVGHVAVLGRDTVGLRAAVLVEVGDRVRLGQPLVADRREPAWRLTAPGTGRVAAIHRGERRALLSVVIELEGDGAGDPLPLASWSRSPAPARLRELLIESGLWMALRTRPYGRPPPPGATPRSIFVTAIDSEPGAPRPELVIAEQREAFAAGLRALAGLTEGAVHVCAAPRAELPVPDAERVRLARFAGPHPAGLPGTHIHFLDPVGPGRTVWYVGWPDVLAIGRLLADGVPWSERVIALSGPLMRRPRLVRTRAGAALDELLAGELERAPARVLSGSVLDGRHAAGPERHLGRFHRQVSAVREASEEPFTGERFSLSRVFPASWRPGRRFRLSTARQGAAGPFLPVPAFERVTALGLLPSPLLAALLIGDVERAQALGCLELEEEDLALHTFVCPAKLDYGAALRRCLEQIEREG